MPEMNRRSLLFGLTAFGIAPSLMGQSAWGKQTGAPPRRRALLIGVNGYERKDSRGERIRGPWDDLNTTPDLQALVSVLKSKFGFQDGEIRQLSTPNETTHAAIVGAFREWLIEPARPGDTLYVHYSGHGGLQYDKEGRPHPTLVPSDWRNQSDPKGHNEILDDELGGLLSELRAKLGDASHLALTFDCCHSGHIVASARDRKKKVRGRNPAFVVAAPKNAKTARGGQKGSVIARGGVGRGFAALLACRYDQSAIEIEPDEIEPDEIQSDEIGGSVTGKASALKVEKPMGRLSYFLAQALLSSGPNTTWRDISEQIQSRMAAKFDDQTPLSEGAIDLKVMQGTAAPIERYTPVLVKKIGDAPAPVPTLRAGRLHGVLKGGKWALYPAGTREFSTAKPIATATVTAVSLAEATLKISPENTPLEALLGARAVETRRPLESSAVRIRVDGIASDPSASAIAGALQKLAADTGLVQIVAGNTGADLSLEKRGDDFALVRQPEATVARNVPGALSGGAPVGSRVKSAVEQIARQRFLKALAHRERATSAPEPTEVSEGIELQMRLVPVKVAPVDPSRAVSLDNARFESDLLAGQKDAQKTDWTVGEWFRLELRNLGDTPAYTTIIDLTPDGAISSVWPRRGGSPVVVPATGKWIRLGGDDNPLVLQVTEPLGTEMLKAIGTADPVDFSPVLDFSPRGAARGGASASANHPLGAIFHTLQKGKRVGVPTLGDETSWGTATAVFRVGR